MNLLIRIILVVALSSVSQVYFPWWSAVLIALAVETIIGKGDATAFFSGFYGLAIPWIIYATYIDVKSQSMLTLKILELFSLPQFSFVLIILTGLLGGLAGGVGSMAGGWIKAALSRKDG